MRWTKRVLIRWPNFTIDPELARKVHFDRAEYDANARDPHEVWAEFAPLLFSPDYRAVAHNLLGFDFAMLATWQRLMGTTPNYSYLYRPCLDTLAISKAYRKGFVPDLSSPEAFLRFQYQCSDYYEKGMKTNLGAMCQEFGIDYSANEAHSATYDITRMGGVLRELVKRVEC